VVWSGATAAVFDSVVPDAIVAKALVCGFALFCVLARFKEC
jgi:hypothetical protein